MVDRLEHVVDEAPRDLPVERRLGHLGSEQGRELAELHRRPVGRQVLHVGVGEVEAVAAVGEVPEGKQPRHLAVDDVRPEAGAAVLGDGLAEGEPELVEGELVRVGVERVRLAERALVAAHQRVVVDVVEVVPVAGAHPAVELEGVEPGVQLVARAHRREPCALDQLLLLGHARVGGPELVFDCGQAILHLPQRVLHVVFGGQRRIRPECEAERECQPDPPSTHGSLLTWGSWGSRHTLATALRRAPTRRSGEQAACRLRRACERARVSAACASASTHSRGAMQLAALGLSGAARARGKRVR